MSRLLPTNHKARHLHGISLRNLALIKTTRPRGHTIDDEQLPTSLSSPAKLLAQNEGRLGHSQSFSDLKSSAIEEEEMNGSAHASAVNGSPQKAKLKRRQPLRRKSTRSWSLETPENRQRLMEETVAERRVDSFFTIHRPGKYDEEVHPTYISEIKKQSMNADFQHFDLSSAPEISRSDRVIVKVFAAKSGEQLGQLIEADVELPSLVWIGKRLEEFALPFSDNAIVFHMSDGVYTLMDFIPNIQAFLSSNLAHPPTPRTATLPPVATSSFDALMKLKDLTELIEDATNTSAAVCKQIETIIHDNKDRTDAVQAAAFKKAAAEAAQDAVKLERKEVKKLRAELERAKKSLSDRREAIAMHRKAQDDAELDIKEIIATTDELRIEQDRVRTAHTGQVRRVAQELLDVFPIEPIEGQLLCFMLCDLYLPNAKIFEDDSTHKGPPVESEVIAAALGFVAQIVSRLEPYLGVPLPYEPISCGSTSTIFDPHSSAKELGLSSTSESATAATSGEDVRGFHPPTPQSHPFRVFPLYQQGVQSKRFRWAIYLLNKDIEELMQHSGCKVIDPRTTLANLKYLLNVLASGKGEMPGRKVGVVKGLGARS